MNEAARQNALATNRAAYLRQIGAAQEVSANRPSIVQSTKNIQTMDPSTGLLTDTGAEVFRAPQTNQNLGRTYDSLTGLPLEGQSAEPTLQETLAAIQGFMAVRQQRSQMVTDVVTDSMYSMLRGPDYDVGAEYQRLMDSTPPSPMEAMFADILRKQGFPIPEAIDIPVDVDETDKATRGPGTNDLYYSPEGTRLPTPGAGGPLPMGPNVDPLDAQIDEILRRMQ